MYKTLRPDPQDMVVALLSNITVLLQQSLQDTTASPVVTGLISSPSSGYLWVNGLYFASLSCSLATAMMIILIKQWIQYYSANLWSGNSYAYARRRQYRYTALQKWHVATIISVLPLLLHIAVVLFATGLIVMLHQINSTIAYTVTGLVGSLLFIYGIGLILPLIYPDCPYKSSASILLGIFSRSAWIVISSVLSWIHLLFLHLRRSNRAFTIPIMYDMLAGLKANISQLKSMTELSEHTDFSSLDQALLDQDSIIWLASKSQDKIIVERSLASVQHLAHTSDMINKFIENDILVELAKKACVPLPAKHDTFWEKNSFIESSAIVSSADIEKGASYLRSLLRAWNHPAYLNSDVPPAISEENKQATHIWLLDNWILLWRKLRQQSDIKTIVEHGWDFENFVFIICVEVTFYQIHNQPKSLPRLQKISLAFNTEEPNPLHDLYDIIEDHYNNNITMSEETIYWMFTVLKQVLVAVHLEHQPDVKQRLLLLLMQCWIYHHSQNPKTVPYQIAICIKLLLIDNPAEKRKFARHESSLNSTFLLEVFTALIQNQQSILQSDGNIEVMTLAAAEVYKLICAGPKLDNKYQQAIFSLPTHLSDELATLSLTHNANHHWNDNTQLQWFVDFTTAWSLKGNLSIEGYTNLALCLQDLLESSLSWKTYAIEPLLHKILSFFVQLNHAFAEAKLAVLHNVMENAIKNSHGEILSKFLLVKGPDKIVAYMQSAFVDDLISKKWKQLQRDLKGMLDRTVKSGHNQKLEVQHHNLLHQLYTQLSAIQSKPQIKPPMPEIGLVQALQNTPVDGADYLLASHMSDISVVALSSDGRFMVSGSWNMTLCIWDTATEKVLGKPLSEHTYGISAVVFSPSGKYIASASVVDTLICIWDVQKHRLVKKISTSHAEPISSITFTPDDQHILSGSLDCTLCSWKISSGHMIGKLTTTSPVTSVAVSEDGQLIASGSMDNKISVWNAATQVLILKLSGHSDSINGMEFIGNRHLISGSSDNIVHIWNLTTETSAEWRNVGYVGTSDDIMHPQKVKPVAVSPNNLFVASASWNYVFCSKVIGNSISHTSFKGHKGHVTAVALSPNQAYIVSGSKDNTVRLWNVQSGKQAAEPMLGHSDEVTSVGYSHNNQHVASGSRDKTIRIWNGKTGSFIKQLSGSDGAVLAIAFSPSNDYIAAGLSNNLIHIWNKETGEKVKSIHGHTAPVLFVTYSTDGMYIMSNDSQAPHIMYIWDISTGQCVKRFMTR
jgi:WD40 repeat protein